MARALTGAELAYLRRDGQRCRLYLAIHSPSTVFTARVNGDPSSDDRLASVTYDGGSADFADAIIDQTVWVGSSAGEYDKGQARLRGTLSGTSGTMKLGEMSAIDWADNDHLTVVDEFGLWPRHLRIDSSGVVYIDYETTYSDQHANADPVPVLGPPAVAWLTGATVNVDFDASDSWVVESTISSYSWSAPDASATAGMATATPTITYDTAGTYRVACTVTAANGSSYTGYRYVFIYDDSNQPTTVFRLDRCSGSWDGGGWDFEITMWDEVLRSEIRDRVMVVLFARDWYGATESSIGPISDRENVVAVGWVAGESIVWNVEQGSVRFEAHGPQWWLGQMEGYPSGLDDYDGTPTDWTEFEDLTVDKGLWHFLHWRTTATRCIDVQLTDDTREIAYFDAPPGSLWQQINRAARDTILAQPCCDRYGRLFIEVEPQYVPTGDRGSFPTVQTIASQDWREIEIQRRTVPRAGLVDLSGVSYSSGSGSALFSLAPGHIPRRYGSTERLDRLALSSQSQSNTLAALVLGRKINAYPSIFISFASNHRGFDVCPHQYGAITINADDTERGITANLNIIAREVAFNYDANTGVFLTEIEFEGETDATGSADGDPPPTPPDPPVVPPLPPIPIPEPDADVGLGIAMCSTSQVVATFNARASSPSWHDLDPDGDLSGNIIAIVVNETESYVTTRDAANPSDTGLWYCADITSPSWNLIKSITDAENDSGYPAASQKCYIGPLYIHTDGTIGALVLSAGNNRPNWPGTVLYYGSGGSVSVDNLPDRSGDYFHEEGGNVHALYYDGTKWYIAGKIYDSPANKPHVCYGVPGSWLRYDYDTITGAAHMDSVWDGYVSDNDADVWEVLSPTQVSGISAEQELPIRTDEVGGNLLYIKNGDDDLYMNGVGIIGDADTTTGAGGSGFGASRKGGCFMADPNDPLTIAWMVRNGATSGTHIPVILTEDGGSTWTAATGDLFTVLGGNWDSAYEGGGYLWAFET